MARILIWSIKDLCDVIENRISHLFDCIIFIDGYRGIGKSTLGYKISSRLNIPTKFNPKRDILYKRDEVIKHIANKKGGVIFADEMINVAHNRDFYIEDQKILVKALNMYRDSRNVFIGCIPTFATIDNQIKDLCVIRITVVRRGVALIQTKISSLYTSDPWDIKNNQRIESKWTTKGSKRPRYSQLTTVRGILRFGDLSPKSRELYEQIKFERRNRIYAEFEDSSLIDDPDKIFYSNLLDRIVKGKISKKIFEEVCIISGRKVSSVRRRLNQMLKDKGSRQTLRDFVITREEKERRDKLGFIVGELPVKKQGNEISPIT